MKIKSDVLTATFLALAIVVNSLNIFFQSSRITKLELENIELKSKIEKFYNFDDSLITQRLLLLEQNDISSITKEKKDEILSTIEKTINSKDDSSTISIWFYEKETQRVLVREDGYDEIQLPYFNYYIYNIDSKKLKKINLDEKSWDVNDNLQRLIHIMNLIK